MLIAHIVIGREGTSEEDNYHRRDNAAGTSFQSLACNSCYSRATDTAENAREAFSNYFYRTTNNVPTESN